MATAYFQSELSVAMETRILIRSGPKPNAACPQANDDADKIAIGPLISEIFMFEGVDT